MAELKNKKRIIIIFIKKLSPNDHIKFKEN
jgi:hypothetical protein